MPLYHCSAVEYQIGEEIIAGNWGRNLLNIGPAHHCWNREIILESVRCEFYPEKPSRLKSAFYCDDIDTIRCYKSKQCSNGKIYEVSVIDNDAPLHESDFNCVEPFPGRSENMCEIAHLYWRYALKTDVVEWPNVVCKELLTLSNLEVLGIVE